MEGERRESKIFDCSLIFIVNRQRNRKLSNGGRTLFTTFTTRNGDLGHLVGLEWFVNITINNYFMMLLRLSRFCSASAMFADVTASIVKMFGDKLEGLDFIQNRQIAPLHVMLSEK